jgi:predicted lipoprotein with Yx(FWY)xxD motif
MTSFEAPNAAASKRFALGAGLAVAALALAACGSSSSGGNPAVSSGGQPSSPSSGSGGSADTAGTMFSIANVSGLGNVVVDGRGHTVYVLTKAGHKNLPCTDATGCTKYWPDLSLPDGTSSATAGHGLNASLLGAKKANGEIYGTYNGWLLYEYSGDTAAGQSHGEGIKDFGGVWYALDASGNLVKPGSPAGASSSSSSSSSSGGGGYGY